MLQRRSRNNIVAEGEKAVVAAVEQTVGAEVEQGVDAKVPLSFAAAADDPGA